MDRFARVTRSGAAVAAIVVLLALAPAVQAAGTLYGMFYDSTLQVYQLGVVNSADASVALTANSIPARWISSSGNQMAVDAELGVAWVVAGPNTGPSSDRSVYTVDLATGAELDAQPLQDAVAPVPDLNTRPFLLEYDDASKTIFVLVQTVPAEGARVWYLATLDPTSGEVDPIGDGFSLFTAGSVSAFDQSRGRFHFVGRDSDVGLPKIYTIDVDNGAVSSNPDVSSGVALLSTSPDFLDYDAAEDRLLGLFGSTATDPRTRHLMVVDTASGALSPVGDTFQERFAQSDIGAFDPETGTWYVTLRGSDDDDYRLHVLDTDAESDTLLSNDLYDNGDPQVRNTPDFLRLVVPEPQGAGLVAIAALALCAARRRARDRSSRASPFS